jgi:hypothetical protein
MPLKLLSSGGGSVLLTANTTASDFTVNVPAVNGNMVTTADTGSITQAMLGAGVYAGYGPAFSAYLSVAQSISNNTWTKLQANIEEFDTASCYDNATNYRFTPNVAGYYQISGNICFSATSGLNGNTVAVVYKNGSRFKDGNLTGASSSGALFYSVVSTVIYLNGSTDYVELWGLIGGTGTLTFGVNSGTQSYFSGCLLRAA